MSRRDYERDDEDDDYSHGPQIGALLWPIISALAVLAAVSWLAK